MHFHWLFNEMISLKEIVNIKQKLIISTHDLWFINGSSHFNTISKKDGFFTTKFKKFLKKRKIEIIKKRKCNFYNTWPMVSKFI